jgi:predicted nucleotidyltransferase
VSVVASSRFCRGVAFATGRMLDAAKMSFMELPPGLSMFPGHRKLAENILVALLRDDRVSGIYLSGSFAFGKPDRYSDLDLHILVPAEGREAIERDHTELRNEVGSIVSDFPALHLGDPHQFVTLYREDYPIHVDYQYRIPDELVPRPIYENVFILFDRTGTLQLWKDRCATAKESYEPTQEQLQYFEDRFWAWCVYTDQKIRRGELWEARDATEDIRNLVLVRLAYFSNSLRSEGSRRLETKFSRETLDLLETTIPRGHSREDYKVALLALADCYVCLMEETGARFGVHIREKDRGYFKLSIES